MAAHSSVLAWKIPWIEEPEGLQPMRSQSQTQLSIHAVLLFMRPADLSTVAWNFLKRRGWCPQRTF